MALGLAEEGDFDVVSRGEFLVVIAQGPVPVVKRENPWRVLGDGIAVALGLENAGKLDFVREIALEPFPGEAGILAIHLKSPFACERQGFGENRRGGDEQQGEKFHDIRNGNGIGRFKRTDRKSESYPNGCPGNFR